MCSPNYTTPEAMNYNFTVQREFVGNAVFSIGYVGALGRHLIRTIELPGKVEDQNSRNSTRNSFLEDVGGKEHRFLSDRADEQIVNMPIVRLGPGGRTSAIQSLLTAWKILRQSQTPSAGIPSRSLISVGFQWFGGLLNGACTASEKTMLLRQQNVPQPRNGQCALVQGAIVEVGEREVLASCRFVGAAQAPPFAGAYVISR
jgi:hypothetical protein